MELRQHFPLRVSGSFWDLLPKGLGFRASDYQVGFGPVGFRDLWGLGFRGLEARGGGVWGFRTCGL